MRGNLLLELTPRADLQAPAHPAEVLGGVRGRLGIANHTPAGHSRKLAFQDRFCGTEYLRIHNRCFLNGCFAFHSPFRSQLLASAYHREPVIRNPPVVLCRPIYAYDKPRIYGGRTARTFLSRRDFIGLAAVRHHNFDRMSTEGAINETLSFVGLRFVLSLSGSDHDILLRSTKTQLVPERMRYFAKFYRYATKQYREFDGLVAHSRRLRHAFRSPALQYPRSYIFYERVPHRHYQ